RDATVLGIEHEMAAGAEDAADLRVETSAGCGLEAAHEAGAEDEVERGGREREREAVAADEPPGEPARLCAASRFGEHAGAEIHADRERDGTELGTQPRRAGRDLEHAPGAETTDEIVQERDLPRMEDRAERLGLPLQIRLDDVRIVVELLQAALAADR